MKIIALATVPAFVVDGEVVDARIVVLDDDGRTWLMHDDLNYLSPGFRDSSRWHRLPELPVPEEAVP